MFAKVSATAVRFSTTRILKDCGPDLASSPSNADANGYAQGRPAPSRLVEFVQALEHAGIHFVGHPVRDQEAPVYGRWWVTAKGGGRLLLVERNAAKAIFESLGVRDPSQVLGAWKRAGVLHLEGEVRAEFYTRRTYPAGREFLALRWPAIDQYLAAVAPNRLKVKYREPSAQQAERRIVGLVLLHLTPGLGILETSNGNAREVKKWVSARGTFQKHGGSVEVFPRKRKTPEDVDCYILFMLRDDRGTFLAFAAPEAKIPPGQLVRLHTPAGAKLRGRIFYLMPIRTSAAIIPLDSVRLIAIREEDFGPQLRLTLVGTPTPNLTVIFDVRF
jgi:hypothetical protein